MFHRRTSPSVPPEMTFSQSSVTQIHVHPPTNFSKALWALSIIQNNFPLYGKNDLILPSLQPDTIDFPSLINSIQLHIAYSLEFPCYNSIFKSSLKLWILHIRIESPLAVAKISAKLEGNWTLQMGYEWPFINISAFYILPLSETVLTILRLLTA